MRAPDAVTAFPTRPMAVRPPAGGSWWQALLGFVVVAGLGGGAAAWFGPGILNDLRMQDDARPVVGGRVTDGRCSVKLGVLWLCDATLRANGKNGPVEDGMHYAFFDWPGASQTALVMQSPSLPEHLTTDIGLERMTNRILTLGGWVLLWLAVLVAGAVTLRREAVRRRRIVAAARTGVAPMAVRLLSAAAGGGARQWKIGYDDGGPHTVTWRVGKTDEPFLISPDGWMLALRGPPGVPPMPLDDRLAWADLTAEERQRVVASRDAQWAQHPAV